MSYCVNCGVELSVGAKACPLCQTEVLNPRELGSAPPERQYPTHIEPMNMRKLDRKGLALICTVFLLIPAFITLVANFVTSGRLSWSLIVVDSLFLVFMWLVSPLYGKKYHPSRHMALGFGSTLLFLFLLERLTVIGWFWPLGAPIVGVLAVLVIGLYFIFSRKNPPTLVRAALSLIAVGLFNVAVELITARFVGKLIINSWSVFVIIPCVLVAIAALILERRKELKEQMKKRLFF